jgi:hypothetical protein
MSSCSTTTRCQETSEISQRPFLQTAPFKCCSCSTTNSKAPCSSRLSRSSLSSGQSSMTLTLTRRSHTSWTCRTTKTLEAQSMRNCWRCVTCNMHAIFIYTQPHAALVADRELLEKRRVEEGVHRCRWGPACQGMPSMYLFGVMAMSVVRLVSWLEERLIFEHQGSFGFSRCEWLGARSRRAALGYFWTPGNSSSSPSPSL